MRQQLRRLSLALGITKPGRPTAEANDSRPESFSQILSQTKAKYLEDVQAQPTRGREWTVVMGNEAGDLDSVASSIAFAWILSNVHQKQSVPLIQTKSEDLSLRPENLYALSLSGLTDPTSQLLTISDTASLSPFPSTSFALVDHNRLGESFGPPETANVVAVVDHHEDEKLYPNADPRLVAPCGSCASHVALLCPSEVPPELATLLLTAILIDTHGLKPGGKGTDTDVRAVTFLAPRSTYATSIPANLLQTSESPDWGKIGAALNKARTIKELTKTLKTKKEDVSLLSGRDLLRRDYKEYTFTLPWAGGKVIKAGLASVPVSLKMMGKAKGGKLEQAMGEWVEERGLTVLGVLTSFKKDGKGKREEAWFVQGKKETKGKEKEDGGDEQEQSKPGERAESEPDIDVNELATRLWTGLEANADLNLKKHKKVELEKKKLPEGTRGKAYKQGNADANRKVVAPALKKVLESETVAEEKKDEEDNA